MRILSCVWRRAHDTTDGPRPRALAAVPTGGSSWPCRSASWRSWSPPPAAHPHAAPRTAVQAAAPSRTGLARRRRRADGTGRTPVDPRPRRRHDGADLPTAPPAPPLARTRRGRCARTSRAARRRSPAGGIGRAHEHDDDDRPATTTTTAAGARAVAADRTQNQGYLNPPLDTTNRYGFTGTRCHGDVRGLVRGTRTSACRSAARAASQDAGEPPPWRRRCPTPAGAAWPP